MESQGPCPYANIGETCDNYMPAAEFQPALSDQLKDVQALQAEAAQRGWTGEEDEAGTSPEPSRNTSTAPGRGEPHRGIACPAHQGRSSSLGCGAMR